MYQWVTIYPFGRLIPLLLYVTISVYNLYGRKMAVPNQFVDVSTDSSVPVPYLMSTTSRDVVVTLNCDCGFPLAEVISLTGVCLLAAICLGFHLARVLYYVLYGIGAGVFILDR
jgi:hypothetical protein